MITSARDRVIAQERIQNAAGSSASLKDWKTATIADVAESHAIAASKGGKATGAEQALAKSALQREVDTINAFLASHKNTRTGAFDEPFSLEEWAEKTPKQRRDNLAVVESVLNSEALSRQARIANAQRPMRREPLTANPFATTKERT